jgi:dTDP-glucose pyrophosphorylase
MKKPTLLILAAGLGSRYGGLKQLDSVGPKGETIIDYSIYDAIRAGFGKVVCVIRESFASDFRSKITAKFEGKIQVELVFQPMETAIEGLDFIPKRTKPWGTGHAVLCAKEVINEPFAMINADDYYGVESMQLLSNFLMVEATPEKYGMVGFILKNTLSPHGSVSRGVCRVDSDGNLVSVGEHSDIHQTDENGISALWQSSKVELDANMLVSMNMWGFHHDLFNYLESRFKAFAIENHKDPKAEFYIPLVVNELIQSNQIDLNVLSTGDKWYGVTYQADKDDVSNALARLTKDALYPSPLWA